MLKSLLLFHFNDHLMVKPNRSFKMGTAWTRRNCTQAFQLNRNHGKLAVKGHKFPCILAVIFPLAMEAEGDTSSWKKNGSVFLNCVMVNRLSVILSCLSRIGNQHDE